MNKNEIFKKMKKDVVYFFWKNNSPLIVCAKICGIENEIGEQIAFYKFLNDNFSNLIKEKNYIFHFVVPKIKSLISCKFH